MWQFKLRTLDDLRTLAADLGVAVEANENLSVLAEPVQVGALVAPNSLAVHPMEGCDGDNHGRPGKLTWRRYERLAVGGAGLLWVEAIAVVPEGRANPQQLWLNETTKDEFAELLKRIRQLSTEQFGQEHRPIIVAQLTHSGRYSKPQGVAEPIIPQQDPYRDLTVPKRTPISDDYLDRLVEAYVSAARLAFEVGFDGVDIKSCHGYLINELLACHTRPGKYGGSFENRTRFLLSVIDRIRREIAEDKLLTVRLGIYDAIPYPYGWAVDKLDQTKPDLAEPRQLIALLADRGVRLINTTIANPYYNPHYGRPFNQPTKNGYEEPEHPLVGVSRMIQLTADLQKAFPAVAMVGTGYSWLRTLMPYVAAASKANGWAAFVGVGRMAFAYPDFAKDILQKGKLDANKVCLACSACTQIMRDGGMTGCVIRDNKIYGPIYKHGRMSNKDNLVRLAASCLQCQEPTCRQACPAGIDIPGFIRQFLDGDEQSAYETIRQANVLPEVCAWLCPVEQQCQGHCLQRYIGDGSVPIADIQRYLAEQANRKGWSGLNVPEAATGKNVAIIGAGPAGLACAAVLIREGHTVTIYDKGKTIGGMIRSVIPSERQGQSLSNEIDAIFQDVPSDRMILRLGTELNAEFNLDQIMDEGFDAAFIGMGLPNAMVSSDEHIDGLWNALDFLAAARGKNQLDLTGKQVAVIGGGNTAMDAAVAAKRHGAEDVYVIYRRSFDEMPAWPDERDRAMAAGVHFLILTQQLSYHAEQGKLAWITVCPTRLGKSDSSGRRAPEPIKASSYAFNINVAIEAIGQEPPSDLEKLMSGVTIKNGRIRTKGDSFETHRRGVFAGGDLVRGASTVVAAVANGMAAASQIDRFLKDQHKPCP